LYELVVRLVDSFFMHVQTSSRRTTRCTLHYHTRYDNRL